MSETGKKWKLGLTLNEQVDLLEQERARMTREIVSLEERVERLERQRPRRSEAVER